MGGHSSRLHNQEPNGIQMSFNQFPDYQTLTPGTKGEPGKANRSVPDRIKEYGILNYIDKDSTVLDLGCNRGYFGTVLSPHIGSYLGIDSDANQIAQRQVMSNMELRVGNFSPLDEKFDVILCFAFHSYVGIPMEVFAKSLVNMLKEDGTLFIEGHPKGYRGEPQQYLFHLKEELSKTMCIIEQKGIKDRELIRPFFIYKPMTGMVSTCQLIGDVLEKTYYPDEAQYKERGIANHWRKEVGALKLLKGLKHFPQLIEAKDGVIKMSYCGERLRKDNLPKDWKEQCRVIDAIQRRLKMYHYDIKVKNICVLNGAIHLIDWGLWSNKKNHFTKIEEVINNGII